MVVKSYEINNSIERIWNITIIIISIIIIIIINYNVKQGWLKGVDLKPTRIENFRNPIQIMKYPSQIRRETPARELDLIRIKSLI